MDLTISRFLASIDSGKLGNCRHKPADPRKQMGAWPRGSGGYRVAARLTSRFACVAKTIIAISGLSRRSSSGPRGLPVLSEALGGAHKSDKKRDRGDGGNRSAEKRAQHRNSLFSFACSVTHGNHFSIPIAALPSREPCDLRDKIAHAQACRAARSNHR